MSGREGTPVLEISGAVPEPAGSRLPSVPLDLRVMAGDCILIHVGSALQARDFADLCCGLIPLRNGSVRFLGRDWANTPNELGAALRGHIGRALAAKSWIGFLPTDINILLAQLHHTRLAEHALRATATELSVAFGLPGLPVMRPDALTSADLLRASCVRAFMGQPRLLFLENPELERVEDLVPALLNALLTVHDQPAASIWLTPGELLWNDRSFPASVRLRLAQRGLVPVRGTV